MTVYYYFEGSIHSLSLGGEGNCIVRYNDEAHIFMEKHISPVSNEVDFFNIYEMTDKGFWAVKSGDIRGKSYNGVISDSHEYYKELSSYLMYERDGKKIRFASTENSRGLYYALFMIFMDNDFTAPDNPARWQEMYADFLNKNDLLNMPAICIKDITTDGIPDILVFDDYLNELSIYYYIGDGIRQCIGGDYINRVNSKTKLFYSADEPSLLTYDEYNDKSTYCLYRNKPDYTYDIISLETIYESQTDEETGIKYYTIYPDGEIRYTTEELELMFKDYIPLSSDDNVFPPDCVKKPDKLSEYNEYEAKAKEYINEKLFTPQ